MRPTRASLLTGDHFLRSAQDTSSAEPAPSDAERKRSVRREAGRLPIATWFNAISLFTTGGCAQHRVIAGCFLRMVLRASMGQNGLGHARLPRPPAGRPPLH